MYITVKTPTVRDVNPTNTKTGKYKNPLKILINLVCSVYMIHPIML